MGLTALEAMACKNAGPCFDRFWTTNPAVKNTSNASRCRYFNTALIPNPSATSTSTSSGSSSTTDTTDTTGAPLDPPMPAGICNDGQGPLTSFVEPTPQPEELHIIGVYQATDNVITVNVNRADIPLTLVLSAYEPVKFTLVLAPGVLLEHVILNGYNPHSVEGQGDAMVTDLSDNFDYIVACGYFWPDKDDGCDTPGLVAGAEALTGLQLAAFVGCYEGSSFTID